MKMWFGKGRPGTAKWAVRGVPEGTLPSEYVVVEKKDSTPVVVRLVEGVQDAWFFEGLDVEESRRKSIREEEESRGEVFPEPFLIGEVVVGEVLHKYYAHGEYHLALYLQGNSVSWKTSGVNRGGYTVDFHLRLQYSRVGRRRNKHPDIRRPSRDENGVSYLDQATEAYHVFLKKILEELDKVRPDVKEQSSK